MAHTYYSRLTIVHPKNSGELDPRLGLVIAETATTGRFIIADISWESATAPNADTTVAYHSFGEIKIYEPLGMGLFDYIKSAAYTIGCENHLDAGFLLEIEILAEKMPKDSTAHKYIWPIMILATEVKSSVTERGAEYILKFVHRSYHAQTDMVQPFKETITIKDVGTLKEYFGDLQKQLENREFQYAAARQKACEPSGTVAPDVPNPAARDMYHDEYHFILDPKIEKFKFNTKRQADPAIQGNWKNFFRSQDRWDISLRPGTTILQQINKVLQYTEDIANLLPGKKTPQTSDASGASDINKENIRNQLGKPYQFFRVETHSVYKAYDYIRGRYAVKHIFFIFLADQPNLYNYPDELDLINMMENKDKVETKLRYYIQEGLLQKLYYHNYTGLNTDILKVDLNFNQSYALPTFPVIWTDLGRTGPGAMNLQNYNKRIKPYNHANDKVATAKLVINQLQKVAKETAATLAQFEKDYRIDPKLGPGIYNDKYAEYKQLQKNFEVLKAEIAKRDKELAAMAPATTALNTINNRSELLTALKDSYVEDMGGKYIAKVEENYPNLRPRMEIDHVLGHVDTFNNENQYLMKKIFSVLLSPNDIVELELEIIGDPFWLGTPNVLLQGKKQLDKMSFSKENDAELKKHLNSVMPAIDPGWNTKNPVWGDYGVAPQYKGGPLFYFLTTMSDSVFDDNDMLVFNSNDQVVGIYVVKKVINEFRDGKWTQKLMAVRDPTIPSYVLPRGVNGELTFENFMNDVANSPDRAVDKIAENRRAAEAERAAALSGNKIQGAVPSNSNASVEMEKAVKLKQELVQERGDAPAVNNPVTRAEQLLGTGMSREEAYKQAKQEFIDQVKARNEFMEDINKKAYERAGITDKRPYSAETMTSIVLTKSNSGGLDNWKDGNYSNPGPAIYNNPMATGYDSGSNSYYRYNSFDEGLEAGNEYYNFSQDVKPKGKQGPDRLLLPADYKGTEFDYLNKKLKGGG